MPIPPKQQQPVEADVDFEKPDKTKEWVRDTPIDLPEELKPYVVYSDRFFSPLRQRIFAEDRKRRAEV